MYQAHKADGLMVMQALFQNNESAVPTAEDLATWADTYSATFPILSDDSGVGNRFELDGGIPTLTVIGPGAEVVAERKKKIKKRILTKK